MGFWIAKADEIELGVASGAKPADKLQVRGVWGRERLSRLYEMDLLLVRFESAPFTDAELADILHTPMAVSIGPKDTDLFHGVLAQIEVIDTPSTEVPRYFARLVPTVWLLTLSRTSRVFLDMSVKEIVTKILEGYGFTAGDDFSITTSNNAKREYVVQYEESDWDFIQRWLEREGLCYWFQLHDSKKKEKLVIADANSDFPSILGEAHVKSRRHSNLQKDTERTIWDYHRRLRRTAARVTLLDYDDQDSQDLVKGTAKIADRGFGNVISWADHVNAPEAKAVAEHRAERLACEGATFSGRSDCERLRAGHSFKFSHEDSDPVVEYVVTAIEHRVGQPLYLAGEGQQEAHRYSARFEAIPKAVQYRPPRMTPWPRIDGVIRAHIDTDNAENKFPELDAQGRYWVKMPFDVTVAAGRKASCRIRLASPFSGDAHGLHMPLHRGAEVLVAHIGGDPDRPVLVGAVPNPRTSSPVIGDNSTQSVVRTASGIHIEHEDQQG